MSVALQSNPLIEETILEGKCTACGSLEVSPYLSKFGLDMSRCSDCGLLFTWPIPTPKSIASRYSADWFEKEYLPSYGINPAAPNLTHLAARYAHELDPAEKYRLNNNILDVGAGAGLLLSQAKTRGWNVFGVELSDFGPEYAKEKFGIKINQGTLLDNKFEGSFFDVVIFQDTIEHVPNPAELLNEINRILRPGGLIIISTPNFNSIGRRVLGRAWALISPAEHLCLFTPHTLKVILNNNNFIVKTLSTNQVINTQLIHEDGTTATKWRRRLLRKVFSKIPKFLIDSFSLGDEIYALAEKESH